MSIALHILVGHQNVVIYTRTPPEHYYLELSKRVTYMETHPSRIESCSHFSGSHDYQQWVVLRVLVFRGINTYKKMKSSTRRNWDLLHVRPDIGGLITDEHSAMNATTVVDVIHLNCGTTLVH